MLLRAHSSLFEECFRQELREMIERADTDGDGAITAEDTSLCVRSVRLRLDGLQTVPGFLQHHDKEDLSIGITRGVRH